jgi:hypothetical protein
MALDVYLIPLGADRYELYCEHVVEEASLSPEAPEGTGRIAALLHRAKAAVARVEQENQSGVPPPVVEGVGWRDRMTRKMLCWIAEKVAEQRLLWRLRKESDVVLFFPDDVTGESALGKARGRLQYEADRHLKWTIIDGVLLCLSAVVALVPGPNPLAYYFGFRFFGHYFSRQGAKHGLNKVKWECRASRELTLLREAVPLDAPERERRIREVASALHLQHLATFFHRTAA